MLRNWFRTARKATDEYLAAHPDQRLLLHRIDYTGRIAVKPLAAPTDPTVPR